MGKQKDTSATPARATPSLKKQASSAGSASGQRSIQSFFTKRAGSGTPGSTNGVSEASETSKSVNASNPSLPIMRKPAFKRSAVKNLTPVPSSDVAGPPSSQENENGGLPKEVDTTGFPSPTTPAKIVSQVVNGSSPSRKVPLLYLVDANMLTSYRPKRLSATQSPTMTMTMRMPSTQRESTVKGRRHNESRKLKMRMMRTSLLEVLTKLQMTMVIPRPASQNLSNTHIKKKWTIS